jgi:hypothetical protein
MVNDGRIVFAIDKRLRAVFVQLTSNVAAGHSHVLRLLIEDFVKHNNQDLELRLKQELADYLKEQEKLKLKIKYKEKLFMYYLVSNTLKTIFKLVGSHLVNSGQINMGIISKVIDNVEIIYNNYPEDIKNDLKTEIDNLKLLKDEKILIQKFRLMQVISQKSKVRELEKL